MKQKMDSEWLNEIDSQQKYIYDLIEKYHSFFSKKDLRYKRIVRFNKVMILLLGMGNTILLGIKDVIPTDKQIIIGLVISGFLTFMTAIGSYFNFEEYWMRNIRIHIRLNIIRDNFQYDVLTKQMCDSKLEEYRKQLEQIQEDNIQYWDRTLKKV